MAIEKLKVTTEALEKAGETFAKETSKNLKEGKNLKGALEDGFNKAISSGLDKLFPPDEVKQIDQEIKALNSIEDKVNNSPTEEVKENAGEMTNKLEGIQDDLVKKGENIQENSENEKTLTQEIKEELENFKEILDQVIEIKEKLNEIGIPTDFGSNNALEHLRKDIEEDLENNEEEEDDEGDE